MFACVPHVCGFTHACMATTSCDHCSTAQLQSLPLFTVLVVQILQPACLPHTVWPPVPGTLPTCAEAQSLLNATPFHFNLKGLVCLCICRLELHMEDGSVAQVTGYYNNLEVICSNTLGQSVTMACKPEGTRVVCEPSEPHTCEAVTTSKASICSAH